MQLDPDEVNPLGTMMETMAKHGANVELRQKMPDGSYAPAAAHTMRAIGAQARIATTAQGLESMSAKERSDWAIHMKDRGNEFYANKEYEKAINIYVEALTATDFGGASPEGGESEERRGNVDEVVVPMLCNLAACCIQLKEWGKVIKFCEQCLLLRPQCARALVRRGTAYLHIGEFDKSMRDLTEGYELTSDLAEKGRVQILIGRAEKATEEQRKALSRRRKAMEAAFADGGVDDRTARSIATQNKKKSRAVTNSSLEKRSGFGISVFQYTVAFVAIIIASVLFYLLLETA